MIVILGAMDEEVQQIVKVSDIKSEKNWKPFKIHQGTLEGKHVCIVKCGVGKVLSAMLTQHLIETYEPEAIVFTGLAGSLNSKFQIGDILLSEKCLQHDLEAIAIGFKRGQIPYTDIDAVEADGRLLTLAQAYKPSGFSIHTGTLLTGDQFISHSGKESHRYLTEELNGDAVDMEGASVGTVAMLNDIPFLIIRTISDHANGDSPQNFQEFLPTAAKHATDLVRHMLKAI